MTRTPLVLRLAFLVVSLSACGAEDIPLDPALVPNDVTPILDGALPLADATAPPPDDATTDVAPAVDVQIADVDVADRSIVDVTEPDVAPPQDAGPDARDAAPDVTVKDVNAPEVGPDVTVPPDAEADGEADAEAEESGRGGGGGGGPGPSGG